MSEPLRFTLDEGRCGDCGQPCEQNFPGIMARARERNPIERREVTAAWMARRSCKNGALQMAREVWE